MEGASSGSAALASLSSSSKTQLTMDNLIHHFYQKTTQVIFQSRLALHRKRTTATAARAPASSSSSPNPTASFSSSPAQGSTARINKWFNLDTHDIDPFRAELKTWQSVGSTLSHAFGGKSRREGNDGLGLSKSSSSSSSSASLSRSMSDNRVEPMILQVMLEVGPISEGHSLVLVVKDSSQADSSELVHRVVLSPSFQGEPASQPPVRIVLEEWTLEHSQNSEIGDYQNEPAQVYQKAVILIRSLHTLARLLPAYDLKRISRGSDGLRFSCLLAAGRAYAQPEAISLQTAMPLENVDAEQINQIQSFAFPPLQTSLGSFTIRVKYRSNVDFRLLDPAKETQVSSSTQMADIEQNYFTPTIATYVERKLGPVASAEPRSVVHVQMAKQPEPPGFEPAFALPSSSVSRRPFASPVQAPLHPGSYESRTGSSARKSGSFSSLSKLTPIATSLTEPSVLKEAMSSPMTTASPRSIPKQISRSGSGSSPSPMRDLGSYGKSPFLAHHSPSFSQRYGSSLGSMSSTPPPILTKRASRESLNLGNINEQAPDPDRDRLRAPDLRADEELEDFARLLAQSQLDMTQAVDQSTSFLPGTSRHQSNASPAAPLMSPIQASRNALSHFQRLRAAHETFTENLTASMGIGAPYQGDRSATPVLAHGSGSQDSYSSTSLGRGAIYGYSPHTPAIPSRLSVGTTNELRMDEAHSGAAMSPLVFMPEPQDLTGTGTASREDVTQAASWNHALDEQRPYQNRDDEQFLRRTSSSPRVRARRPSSLSSLEIEAKRVDEWSRARGKRDESSDLPSDRTDKVAHAISVPTSPRKGSVITCLQRLPEQHHRSNSSFASRGSPNTYSGRQAGSRQPLIAESSAGTRQDDHYPMNGRRFDRQVAREHEHEGMVLPSDEDGMVFTMSDMYAQGSGEDQWNDPQAQVTPASNVNTAPSHYAKWQGRPRASSIQAEVQPADTRARPLALNSLIGTYERRPTPAISSLPRGTLHDERPMFMPAARYRKVGEMDPVNIQTSNTLLYAHDPRVASASSIRRAASVGPGVSPSQETAAHIQAHERQLGIEWSNLRTAHTFLDSQGLAIPRSAADRPVLPGHGSAAGYNTDCPPSA